MGETPKKIVGNNCFLCSFPLIPAGRVRVFGKSSVDISGLIESAVEIDVSAFSSSDPFVCTKCYKRLLRFEKIKTNLRTVQEEIKEDYKKGELRTKRLRRDSESDASIVSIESSTVQQRCTAAKSLKFANLPTTCTSSAFTPLQSDGERSVLSEGREDHSSQDSVTLEIPQTPSNEGLFISPPPPSLHLTSTPIALPSMTEPYKSTAVKIAIHYPSKTVKKCLAPEYEAIGKALVYGPPQRIASAVMKCKALTTHVVQSVLRLVSNEVCGLCSRSKPSLLRKCDKDNLVNFTFQSVCEEWKDRAPIFYSFLMTCSSVQLPREKLWLPSVAIAGSVLLKQRNSQMNATASVLGVLVKTGSMEVRISILNFDQVYFYLTELK